jgi:hypothetical protein
MSGPGAGDEVAAAIAGAAAPTGTLGGEGGSAGTVKFSLHCGHFIICPAFWSETVTDF